MALRGSERRSSGQIAEEIEAVGGHINAYTAREQTAYYVKVLKEDTALAADIIGDILTHSTFEPEEMERERGVILQEIGQANDTPDDIIFDHFQEQAYPSQPLGRPVLGSEQGIRSMPRTMLTGYMRRHYAAPNVVVGAAGALTHQQVLDLVNGDRAGRGLAGGREAGVRNRPELLHRADGGQHSAVHHPRHDRAGAVLVCDESHYLPPSLMSGWSRLAGLSVTLTLIRRSPSPCFPQRGRLSQKSSS